MSHKSSLDKEIYEEWERLTFKLEDYRRLDREPLAEQVEGWERLYRKAYENGRWLVSASGAWTVTSLGSTIAFRQYRYADAAKLALQFHDHPDAEDDEVYWVNTVATAGRCLILGGQVDEGLSRLREVLKRENYPLPIRFIEVRNQIQIVLQDQAEDAVIDSRVVGFAASMLEGWKGQKSKARRALECFTNGDLFRLLKETYPNRRTDAGG